MFDICGRVLSPVCRAKTSARNTHKTSSLIHDNFSLPFLSLSRPSCSVKSDLSTGRMVSRLFIPHATRQDTGNYTCALGNYVEAKVAVHVLAGKYSLTARRDTLSNNMHKVENDVHACRFTAAATRPGMSLLTRMIQIAFAKTSTTHSIRIRECSTFAPGPHIGGN